jgi:TPR repeat protein
MLEAGRKVAAFRALKLLAESGEERAYHMVGFMYDVGEGTARSKKNAMRWYLAGYEAGYSSSAGNIATMYRDAGDSRQEIAWYKRAAALGDGDALLEVALRYLSGKGVRRNVRHATDLLKAVKLAPDTTEYSRELAKQLLHACPTRRRVA